MLRTLTIAAILSLTVATAQAAESLTARIHIAAVEACTPESSTNLPVSHYGAITQACIDRISKAAILKYQAEAEAKTKASTAVFVNN
jgi:hypothetical protein